QPGTALAALAAFASGRALGQFLQGKKPVGFWSSPYVAGALLLFAWAGPESIGFFPLRTGVVYGLTVIKSAVMLPLAALMLGLLRGGRGIGFATAGAPVAILVGAGVNLLCEAIGWSSSIPLYLPLEAPLLAWAYAMLGARIAETRGHAIAFPLLAT